MIRSATNSDSAAIKELVFSVLKEYYLEPDTRGIDADLEAVEDYYFQNGWCFDVLLDSSGKIIGTVGLFRINEEICELRKMYLHPSERGKGLGTALLEHALQKATELGFETVTLETASVLKEAISLYTKYGLRPYNPDHMSIRCDQCYIRKLKAESSRAWRRVCLPC